VRRALTKVDWIDQDSVKPDGDKLEVTFTVKDRKQFTLDKVRSALPARYRSGLALLQGPK
jgi:hypothetical protein